MSKNKETISLFMDGEASEFELASMLKQVKQDTSLQRSWESFHLIGDALRNHIPANISAGFSARLSLALDEEINSATSQGQRTNDRAGFALAASISAVALVGLLQFGQSAIMATASTQYETDIQLHHMAMANTISSSMSSDAAMNSAALEMGSQAVAYASFDGDAINVASDMALASDVESTVYDYLVNYSQYAVDTPLKGSVPAENLLSFRID